MPNFEHRLLLREIEKCDKIPDNSADYAAWITGKNHLDLLRSNEKQEELIILATGITPTFIHTVAVNEDHISPLDQDDLLQWAGNSYSTSASYVYGGDRDDVWIERGSDLGTHTLSYAQQLVFSRTFEGLRGSESITHDILQDYLHLAEAHWHNEERCYGRFDRNGNLEPVVSITAGQSGKVPTLISFRRDSLEKYLAVSRSVLIRMFDFTLFRPNEFKSWGESDEIRVNESESLFYRQKTLPGDCGFVRGVQILRPRRSRQQIFSSIKQRDGDDSARIVEYLTYDIRNQRIVKVSTDPSATTNYFEAKNNTLPFETSPAFFRPEVLIRYKSDREKYSVDDHQIRCRNAWELRYGVNDSGQVHVYIVDLRKLPSPEMIYWESFNEPPKSGLSERTIQTDFLAEWPDDVSPVSEVLSRLRSWKSRDVPWWTVRDEALLENISTPRSGSRQEWGEAFQVLSQLIVEGFVFRDIRATLDGLGIPYKEEEKSLVMIEHCLKFCNLIDRDDRLHGLRQVQLIRSKVVAHSGSSQVKNLSSSALLDHETYAGHFEHICKLVSGELALIQQAFERDP